MRRITASIHRIINTIRTALKFPYNVDIFNRNNNSKGFNLIELTLSVAIFTVIMIFIAMIIKQIDNSRTTQEKIKAQYEAQSIMEKMAFELRNAKQLTEWDPVNHTIEFEIFDKNNLIANEVAGRVKYQYDADHMQIIRSFVEVDQFGAVKPATIKSKVFARNILLPDKKQLDIFLFKDGDYDKPIDTLVEYPEILVKSAIEGVPDKRVYPIFSNPNGVKNADGTFDSDKIIEPGLVRIIRICFGIYSRYRELKGNENFRYTTVVRIREHQ
ncbi:MAG: hypothetical protein ABII27_06410 [bacterium]